MTVFTGAGARVRAPAFLWTKSGTAGKQLTWHAAITRCRKPTNFTLLGSQLEVCISVRFAVNGVKYNREIPPSSYQTNPRFRSGFCMRCISGKLPAWFVRAVCDACLDWEIAHLQQANGRAS